MRLYIDPASGLLRSGEDRDLPPGPSRHAQVRRVQPGDTLRLFDGQGCDWAAEVLAVGRSAVRVRVGAATPVDAELPWAVTIALGMPANERMDAVLEKATELGAAAIQPLHTERSVLRLAGERAEKKRAHWQAIAEAACEQCGRSRVPLVHPVRSIHDWLGLQALEPAATPALRLLLSLQPDAQDLPTRARQASGPVLTLNGPEGGLTPDEEQAARRAGFLPTTLGPRVLRADTAPLAALAALAVFAALGPHRNTG
jgi:16S rRNA (uracil1498-N3)-methyltransferase